VAVLPAVEALQTLARSMPASWRANACRQERAVFHHLLAIDPGAAEIPTLHEHERYTDGRCLSKLTTLRTGQRMKLTRRLEHASVWFMPQGRSMAAAAEPAPECGEEIMAAGPPFMVSDSLLYDELVPFGPAYRNVKGGILLTRGGATATVYGGDFPGAVGPLGSPFPLDAAMHAACAWGQRYRNRVVFPVGFDRREILAPTRAGEFYLCRIAPLPDEGAVLRFNVRLYDRDRRPVETILGLMMRDIFGGKLIPPVWIREGA
jgi:hypothetical protein